jgi:hypothetical protein
VTDHAGMPDPTTAQTRVMPGCAGGGALQSGVSPVDGHRDQSWARNNRCCQDRPVRNIGTESHGKRRLPSGRLVRGRALRRPPPPGPAPDFALQLLLTEPAPVSWPVRWVRWPDFRLPRDRRDAAEALREAWCRCASERVEVACRGGRGRTGTALACIAAIDGVPPDEAVAFVRERYDTRAVETPWQRRYVARFLNDDPP